MKQYSRSLQFKNCYTGSFLPEDDKHTFSQTKEVFHYLLFILIPLFFFLELSNRSFAQNWYNSGWAYRKAITINPGMVPSPQSYFPVLVSLISDAGLSAHTLASGNDILFTSGDGVTKTPYQRESYLSGTLVAWVNCPSVTNGTIIFMYYGNPGATDQQQATSTWDANYKGVWHLKETSSPSANSTLTSGLDGSWVNSPVYASAQIDGGLNFNGSNQQDQVASTFSLGTTNITMECWAYMSTNVLKGAFIKIGGTSPNAGYAIGIGSVFQSGGNSIMALFEGKRWITAGTYTAGWHHFAFVINASGYPFVYYDGGMIYSDLTGDALTPQSNITFFGGYTGSGGENRFFNGILDEIRISGSTRTADWILTEYNNQHTPALFYSVSPENNQTTATVSNDVSICPGGSITLNASGGMSAYYPFSSDVNDYSGNGLNLSGSGGTFVAGGGIQLSSAAAYTSPVTSILNTDKYTLSFDMKYTSTFDGIWHQIFAFDPAGTDRSPGLWRYPSSMQMHWRHDPGNTGLGEAFSYTLNQWYHIVGEKNGSTFTLYVDGVQVDQGTVANPKYAGSAVLSFGATGVFTGANMILKEFKIYSGDVRWYTVSCGGTAASNGPAISVSPTVNTTYYARLEGVGNTTACASTLVRITQPVSIVNTTANENCPADNNGTINISLSNGLSNIRYIKLTQQLADWANLAELQAIESFTGTNVALTGTATASSQFNSSYPPSNLIDGISNVDANMWHSGVYSPAGEWIKVDLGSGKNIDYLRIYNRYGCCWSRSANFLLQLYNASNEIVYQKNINVYEGVDGPHSVVQNVLDLSWADGWTTLSRSGLNAGTYTLNYGDACGSVASNISNIGTNYTESTAPTAISGTTAICTGGSTTLTAVGGIAGTGSTLNWFSGTCGTGLPVGQGTSVTVSPSAATNYYVLRSGLCNTTTCAGITATVNLLPTFSVTKSDASCFGGSDGSITVSIISGTGPYEYSSDNGLTYTAPTSSTTYTFTGLTVAGSPYLVRVRDGNACVSQQTCP